MKSKGPIDFFLGVFLEFGAAFCLLFFLPQIPWHWLPAETSGSSSISSPIVGVTALERRVLLRPAHPTLSSSRFSPLAPRTWQAPALLQPDLEPVVMPAAPIAVNIHAQPQPQAFRRDFPRQYRY